MAIARQIGGDRCALLKIRGEAFDGAIGGIDAIINTGNP